MLSDNQFTEIIERVTGTPAQPWAWTWERVCIRIAATIGAIAWVLLCLRVIAWAVGLHG